MEDPEVKLVSMENRKVIKKYNRASYLFDVMEKAIEKLAFNNWRLKLKPYFKGKILEIGVGTGKNMEFYSRDMQITAIDFSSGMLKRAEKKRRILGYKNVTLRQMDIQNLQFDSSSFDTVISTFVFCTVPDPLTGLKEVHRVLKKGGKAVFIEHMKSKKWYLNIFLYIMNIFSKTMLGTSMLRETSRNIESIGFSSVKSENLFFDIVKFIVAVK